MQRFDAGGIAATAICAIGAAGLLGMAAALPATWLQWEADTAQSQAGLMAGAAAAQARSGLGFMFTSFDRATASLRADQLTGDTVPLTAQLLRIEPLVAPVAALAVVNPAGLQVAASSVAIDPAGKPLWWTGALQDLPKHDAGLLGCGGARPYVAGFALARRIADEAGNPAGAVAGLVAAPDLLKMVQPAGPTVAFSLSDAAGCVLLHGNDASAGQAADGQAGLLALYRHVLPAGWGQPAPTALNVTIGNLVWSGTVSPASALALRPHGHEIAVGRAALALAGLAVLLASVPLMLAATRRRRPPMPEPVPEPLPAEIVVPEAVAVPAHTIPVAPVLVTPVPTTLVADAPVLVTPPVIAPEVVAPVLVTPPVVAPEVGAPEVVAPEVVVPVAATPVAAALVVGFTATERQRVAARLESAGLDAETAEDGFMALDLAGRAAYMHGALDLMVLDGASSSLPVHDLLSRLKARGDLGRLRIVLVANGCFAGAFGGAPQDAASFDALVTAIFATRAVSEAVLETVPEELLVAGE